jgi:hypothetical protein
VKRLSLQYLSTHPLFKKQYPLLDGILLRRGTVSRRCCCCCEQEAVPQFSHRDVRKEIKKTCGNNKCLTSCPTTLMTSFAVVAVATVTISTMHCGTHCFLRHHHHNHFRHPQLKKCLSQVQYQLQFGSSLKMVVITTTSSCWVMNILLTETLNWNISMIDLKVIALRNMDQHFLLKTAIT